MTPISLSKNRISTKLFLSFLIFRPFLLHFHYVCIPFITVITSFPLSSEFMGCFFLGFFSLSLSLVTHTDYTFFWHLRASPVTPSHNVHVPGTAVYSTVPPCVRASSARLYRARARTHALPRSPSLSFALLLFWS